MEHSSDITQVQECVWKAYHLLSMVLDSPYDPTKGMVWMTRAVQNLLVILQAAAKYLAIYIPWLLIAASKVFTSGDIHSAPKDLIQLDAPGLEQDQWYVNQNHRQCLTPPLDPLAVGDDKWWLALAPQQKDEAPVEGQGKGKATEQPMEVLMIKVLLMKKWKQTGEDEESDDREEEAEGSRSISTLIFGPMSENAFSTDPCTRARPIHIPTSHLTPAGGSTLTAASAAPPTLVQPCQPSEGNCTYVVVDTFQQVLVQECMTWLEHKMAKMTTTMCCWWDDIIGDYLKLSEHIMTMEENQHRFINQPFMDAIELLHEDLGVSQLEQNTCHVGHMAEVIHTLSRQHCDQGMQTGMDKAGSSGSHRAASDL
ncbi:hypothetical protein ID866_10277 [Astraeus odoratus]|nr:hypothetical protein ID866_10277 [Astraeus odoratus]